ncbi:glycosyltransferase family 2 protein [Zymomonas mobilis]|uniref:Glycosyl transferase family 2 n=1 Tax=Zymomonas mobilis subsp. pomaceae (strain ATCC 29192 / DSM 22645 / JCM 10191 / CCUG 17912 / NBRC 13757 / NCIMB 11200 / NRRL B-4491 / Barker I) TaxID=579138 RepID=F8EUL0_ZYMMT|nr:glycosyltransferase family 2 protein [Zymomonas mobilis]AEI37226.1 glycosyl transferase family 2 [Zymomonas mobilis subsp. pomaceae ATCC 29192]MDX5948596.1 glycosyltransferase family 2 protein [Zymomonas mobilis subsp. pomaceae]GEB88402.1 glycosyl transferase [Zymomonas mobilis subsp. pomaceae]
MQPSLKKTPYKVAVLLPCHNEEAAIGKTVAAFRHALPDASIYVYDNNSSDNTVAVAQENKAIVRSERLQGKGHVVRRMFADIDADVYILADGDATYDADAAPKMVTMLCDEGLDMVVGIRQSVSDQAYRLGHKLGNRILNFILAWLFGHSFTDILSGYRVFSRRFIKSFPLLSTGFEIETEISVHALELQMPVAEVDTRYSERPEGSFSKLSTYRDGWLILLTIFSLFRLKRPMLFFSSIGLLLAIAGIALAVPLMITYCYTGLVPRLPTAVLSTGLVILSSLSFACGLILDTVVYGRREALRLAYLTQPSPHEIF